MPGRFRNSRRMGATPGGRLVGRRGGQGTPRGMGMGRVASGQAQMPAMDMENPQVVAERNRLMRSILNTKA